MVTTTLLLVGAPTVLAGSLQDPEILDAEDDVSPAAVLLPESSPEYNEAFRQGLFANASAYDVTKAFVVLETAEDFYLMIMVQDLPDDWGLAGNPPSESPFGDNASFSGTSLVANFTIGAYSYQAIAKLAMPRDGQLLDNYMLWRGPKGVEISGAYNTSQDWISMRFPKFYFDGLRDGSKLTQFWVMGRYGNVSMDFAPDAKEMPQTPPDPFSLPPILTESGQAVEPQFGREYQFGQYYRDPGPGAMAPALGMSVRGPSERSLNGGAAVYELVFLNGALAPDTVYLVLNGAKPGWSHQLSAAEFTLQSQQTRSVFVTVAASEAADAAMASIVDASSTLGASKRVTLLTTHASGPGGPGGGSGPGSGGVTIIEAPKPGDDSPGLGLALVVGAMCVLVVVLRRRGPR